MEKLKLDKHSLRKFGFTMGAAFLVITLLILIRHRHSSLPTFIISGIFFIFALVAPNLLRPVYIIWMRLAFILGWINTRLILTTLFYLIFTPIGLVMRLFRADLLDRKMLKAKESYWLKKDNRGFNKLDYERQF